MLDAPLFIMMPALQDRRMTERARSLLGRALFILAAIGAIALWAWHTGTEQRAVTQLPPGERGEVYRRELQSFQALCGEGPRKDALEKECRSKADFIVQFPECDQSCQELARPHRETGRGSPR